MLIPATILGVLLVATGTGASGDTFGIQEYFDSVFTQITKTEDHYAAIDGALGEVLSQMQLQRLARPILKHDEDKLERVKELPNECYVLFNTYVATKRDDVVECLASDLQKALKWIVSVRNLTKPDLDKFNDFKYSAYSCRSRYNGNPQKFMNAADCLDPLERNAENSLEHARFITLVVKDTAVSLVENGVAKAGACAATKAGPEAMTYWDSTCTAS